jgi:Cu+-exporting ATPase
MHKTFIVEGMTCAACSSAVERVLNKKDAVVNASVNLTTKKLVIDYDEEAFTVEDIIQTVDKAGYSATEHVESKTIVMPIDGMT